MGYPCSVSFVKEDDQPRAQQNARKNAYQVAPNPDWSWRPPPCCRRNEQLEFKFTWPKAQLELFDGR